MPHSTRAALALLALLAVAPDLARSAPFDIALIGDFPYSAADVERMPALLADLREAAGIAFLIHLGDLHGGDESPGCSDALFQERLDGILSIGLPWVVTPGDNDWVDCDGSEGSSLDRLAAFRRIFFPDPRHSFGPDPFPLRRQSEGDTHAAFVENALWVRDGVVFATVHLLNPAGLRQGDREGEAHKALLVEAGRAWLSEVFDHAREIDARGVFLSTQASLWPTSGQPRFNHYIHPGLMEPAASLRSFERDLAIRTRDFARPVVLAHGDTHYFRIDKPLADEGLDMLENFTRVEGFGSPHGHWVRVQVDPDRPEVFSFRQELVAANQFTLIAPAERPPRPTSSYQPVLEAVRGVRLATPVLAWIGVATLLVLAGRLGRRAWRRARRAP